MDFFYAEEETSLRVYKLDAALNTIYKFFKLAVLIFVSIAGYRHYVMHRDMKKWARAVSTKIEKTGGAAVINEDRSVSIIMDGKVQEVIHADDRRLSNDSSILKNNQPRQHLRIVVTKLLEGRDIKDYHFYKEVIKPEIQEFNPALYKMLL